MKIPGGGLRRRRSPGPRKRLHYFLFSPPHHSGCCIQRRFFDIAVSRSPGAVRRACIRDFGCGCPFLAGCSVNRQDDDRHTRRTEHVQQIKPVSCCGGSASQLSDFGAWRLGLYYDVRNNSVRYPGESLDTFTGVPLTDISVRMRTPVASLFSENWPRLNDIQTISLGTMDARLRSDMRGMESC